MSTLTHRSSPRASSPSLVQRQRISGGVRAEPQYLTGMDLFNSHAGVPSLFVYPQGLDVPALQQSLARVLAHYPVLAGRLTRDDQGHVCVDLNDAGVEFKVTRRPGPLPAHGLHQPLWPQAGAFFKPILPWQVVDRDCPLMVVEVHEFDGGGVILSITGVHSVCDGASFWAFMLDWVRVHQGHDIVPPVLDRNAVIRHSQAHAHLPDTQGLVAPASPWRRAGVYARFAWNHVAVLDKTVFRVQAETLQQWKAQARDALPQGVQPSPADLVGAHCLQLLSPHMRSRQDRVMGLVTDLRFRRNLCLPRKYVGNALMQQRVSLSQAEVAQADLVTLASRCHVPLDSTSTDDLLGYMAVMERHRAAGTIGTLFARNLLSTLDAGIVLNNCTHFSLYKIDFGSGRPQWHDHPRPAYRIMFLVPTPTMDGGVDVHLTAPRHEVAAVRAVHG